MSFIGKAIGSIVGGVTGATQSAKAASNAGKLQANTADQAIALQREQLDRSTALEQPYVDAGSKALAAQMGLIGLNGTAGQQDAINALLTSPEYTTATRQGEEAILQNASATGGLRGGNTQGSLANFRADLLANLINTQFTRLGGITSIGQNAAAGVGNAGMQITNNIGSLLGDKGSALAGGLIAKGNVTTNAINSAAQIAKAVAAF